MSASFLGHGDLFDDLGAKDPFDDLEPDDAGVIRVDEATGRGVAISTDANGRFTKLDPATGAAQALAESYRNVCTVGARPLAVTDCLNFGSPEDPDAMWQLVEAITGPADARARPGGSRPRAAASTARSWNLARSPRASSWEASPST